MEAYADRDRLLRMANYPGMIASESRVLREYIRRHFQDGDEFRFNVRIGEGQVLGPEHGDALRRSWEALTKARPDTVQWRAPGHARLIEAKEIFANDGVWQLLGYRDLYHAAFPDDRIDLVGVVEIATPTARQLARAQGVALFLYRMAPDVVDVSPDATEEATNGI